MRKRKKEPVLTELDKEFGELLESHGEGTLPGIVEITTENFHASAISFQKMPIGLLAKIAVEDIKLNSISWVYYLEAAKLALSKEDYDTLWNLTSDDFPEVVVAWLNASAGKPKQT